GSSTNPCLLTKEVPGMSGLVLALVRLFGAVRRAYEDSEFRVLLLLMITLLISGTFFYAHHEEWSYIDALYFCVMTMSTIGYGDLTPTSSLSKVFTIVYAMVTIGVFVGVASKLASAMLTKKHKHSVNS
ncbi:MAG: two pore domain potassium channel family protein, partial [Pseudomonadota bacterium]